MNKPLYYMWVYSPTTEHVTLAHDEEAPRAHQEYHSELSERRYEDDLVHGYAYRIGGGWRITDWEHKMLTDPRVKRVIVQSILRREGIQKQGLNMLSYDMEEAKKWAWIEGQPPTFWEDQEHNMGGWYGDDGFNEETGEYDEEPEEDIVAHFEVLVELALRDPQLLQVMQQFKGVSYQRLEYNDVAIALARSGKKWAVGVFDGREAQIGAKGPTTTKEEVQQMLGVPTIDLLEEDYDVYALDQDQWEFPDQSPLKFDEFHYGQPRQDMLS